MSLFRLPAPPCAATAGARSAIVASTRGQAASGLRGASYGHLRVRTNLLVLRLHSPAADERPLAGNSKPGMLLCSKFRLGALGSNLTKWKGLTTKSMTRMNSAVKDLFVGNILNFGNS